MISSTETNSGARTAIPPPGPPPSSHSHAPTPALQQMADTSTRVTSIPPQMLQLGYDNGTVDVGGGQVAFVQAPAPQIESHGSANVQPQTRSSPSPRTQWPEPNSRTPVNGTRSHDQRSFKGLQEQVTDQMSEELKGGSDRMSRLTTFPCLPHGLLDTSRTHALVKCHLLITASTQCTFATAAGSTCRAALARWHRSSLQPIMAT